MLIDFGNNLWISSALALQTGILLGVFYFSGLWWTVRRLGSSQYVALLFLGSLLFRTGVVIVGFYFILGNNWPQLLLGLLGFIILRGFAIRLIRRRNDLGLVIEPVLAIKQKKPYAP